MIDAAPIATPLVREFHQRHLDGRRRMAMAGKVQTAREAKVERMKAWAAGNTPARLIERMDALMAECDWWPPKIVPKPPAKAIAPCRIIQEIVCSHFGVLVIDLLSDRRLPGIVHPRQLGYLLARNLTRYSTPVIGRAFGDRDHSTVLAGIKATKARMAADPAFAAVVAQLEAEARLAIAAQTGGGA